MRECATIVALRAQGVLVVVGELIRHARDSRVHVAAAERLVVDVLADRSLHERRPGEIDRALVLHDHRFVAHRGHVCAAGRARAHHDGDLRDSARGQLRLVVEDAAEVIAIRETPGPAAARTRRPNRRGRCRAGVLERDLLCSQMLLDRERVVRAAFHRRVVRDDHAAHAADRADAGDNAGRGQRLVVHAVRGQAADLEPRRLGVEQLRDSLAREQLAALAVTRAGTLRAALLDLLVQTASSPKRAPGCARRCA